MRFTVLGLITVDGTAPGAPQLRRLLAELLVARHRPVPQDVIIEALWDGEPPPAAVSALQSKISRLRRLLAAGQLRTTPAGYVLDVADAEYDAACFERLAGSGRTPAEVAASCAEALELWRGAAFEVAAGDPLVEPEARRLELLRHRTIERRLDALGSLGRHDDVLALSGTLIAENPFAERAWAGRITALARLGRKVDALRAADELRRLLADETGLPLSPAMARLEQDLLLDRLTADVPVPDGAVSGGAWREVPAPERVWTGEVRTRGPMAGRPALASAVRSWIEGVRRGEPASAVVLAGAGAGKTSLVHDLAARAQRAGVPVRTLRSRSVDQPPFLPFGDVGAGPTLATARSLAVGLRDEAQHVGGLVVAFDDLHRADAGTAEVAVALVESLAERSGPLPLAVVLASRPPPPGSDLDRHFERLTLEPFHRHWTLAPLDEAGVHDVVLARTGLAPTPALVAALTEAAAGSPYVVLAHLRALRRRRALLVTAEGRLHASARTVADVPADLPSELGAALAGLSAEARLVLAVAAVGVGSLDEVRAVCGLSGPRLDAALSDARALLTVHTGHDQLDALHDLSRGAVRAALTDEERREVHRRLAEHRRSHPIGQVDPDADLFDHALGGGLDAEPWVVPVARRAAESATGARRWADAAARHAFVADHEPGPASWLDAGVAAFRNHDAAECRRHLVRAVTAARATGDLALEARAALVLQRSELNLSGDADRFDAAALTDLAARLSASVGVAGSAGLAAQAWGLVAEARFHSGEHRGGLALVERASALGLGPEEHPALAALSFAEGLCRLGLVDLAGAEAAFDLARRHAESGDDGWKLAWCLGRLALVALHRGQGRRALQWCEQARAVERPTGNWAELALTETVAATAHAVLGDLDRSVDVAHEALALTRRSAYAWTAGPALGVLLHGACVRGDEELVDAVLSDMAELTGELAADRWRELATLVLAGAPPWRPVPGGAEPAPAVPGATRTSSSGGPPPPGVAAPAAGNGFEPDIRRLPALGLRAEVAARSSAPLPAATAAALADTVRAGARRPLGWPFDLAALAASTRPIGAPSEG